jgi:error-prone DNA polymerase
MVKIEERLRKGMRARGFSKEAEDQIVLHITSFALYGFPESHSASFALIAYASAYLKQHHPAAFLVGLLRAQPMGFYSPATLIKDAQRHGVEVRPIDITFSKVLTDLEAGSRTPASGMDETGEENGRPAVRIGLDSVGGLNRKTAERIVRERTREAFKDLGDLVRRVSPARDELEALAELGALVRLHDASGTTNSRRDTRDSVQHNTRRSALWQVAALERDRDSLFAGRAIARPASSREAILPSAMAEKDSPLPPMTEIEETLADYRLSGLTTGVHVMAHLRESLDRRGVLPAAQLRDTPDGTLVRTAGHAIVRQRPGSAKGFCFVTLEDETGLSNAILTPDITKRFRIPLNQASLLEIAGRLQRVDGVIHVRAREIIPLDLAPTKPPNEPPPRMPSSHDYR